MRNTYRIPQAVERNSLGSEFAVLSSGQIPGVWKTFGMMIAPRLLEQLEPRIAPAAVVLTSGGNLLSSGDQGYLSEADAQGDATLLVKCLGGKALVFWDADDKQIRGISLSDGGKIEVTGNIFGDIVTNLETSGFLSDSDNDPSNGLDGGRLLAASIAGVKTTAYFDANGAAQNGDVGRIIAGGSAANINLNGRLGGVFTGDGIFDAVATASSPVITDGIPTTQFQFVLGNNFDSSGPADLSTMTLKMSDATFAPAASINGVSFSSGVGVKFFSGDGADGTGSGAAAGGSVSKVSFVGAIVDTAATGFFAGKSYTVSAGHGGDVSEADAGAGGSISGLSETGSGGNVYIHAGDGGNGGPAKGRGGNGGSIGTLDLLGGVLNYDIQSGSGGNGASGGHGGSVSTANITSQGPISLAGPFFDDKFSGFTAKDFFVINRSTAEMTLIDGSTLTSSPIITPLAAGPVDALMADLNNDNYLDVVVLYADETLGILINNGGDGTFKYTVKDLGFEPFRVLAGEFVGDGGNPELTIISTNKIQTTLRLYSATDPTEATSFTTDTSKFKPLALKKGNLADAVGGSSPLGLVDLTQPDGTTTTFFWGMEFEPAVSAHKADLTLAFADGTLQGVISGDKAYTTSGAPKLLVPGGIRDVDFNFPDLRAEKITQSLAIVNAAGSAASIVNITTPPPPEVAEGETPPPATASNFIFVPGSQLPLKSGAGTLLEVRWTDSSLPAETAALTLLASNGTASTVSVYSGSFTRLASYSYDYLINSTANNFLFALAVVPADSDLDTISLAADSYFFTTGNVTVAKAYQATLPSADSDPVLLNVSLPFSPKTVALGTGAGGSGKSGSGGNGGEIASLNLDSNFGSITTGAGGPSESGAGGHGGSLNNSASFKTSLATIKPSFGVTDTLSIVAGSGASVTGSSPASKGGNGGSIGSVIFSTIGHFESGAFVLGSLSLQAGNGGSSESLAAGNGGSITTTAVYSAKDVTLTAGSGGNGSVGAKATGGQGGYVAGITGGDVKSTGKRSITGDVEARAGSGGNSAFTRAGNGGSITSTNIQNMVTPAAQMLLQAGGGGSSGGLDASAAGGAGGSISSITSQGSTVQPTLVAGQGGNAVGGSGGAGGSLSGLIYSGGIINLTSGTGGNSTGLSSKGAGGAGGAISGIKAEIKGSGYMTIQSGSGGTGTGAAGGAGGAIANVFLKLDPADKSSADETLAVTIGSGAGGAGSKGGNGGHLSGISCEGVYNHALNDSFTTVIDSIAMRLLSGNGGAGTTGDGGTGGTISFTKPLLGISQIDADSTNPDFLPGDEALRVLTGDGGAGAGKGGAGGALSGIKAANVKNGLGDPIARNLLGSALIQTGSGGDGGTGDAGSGGALTNAKLSVERQGTDQTGNLRAWTGNGGNSASGKGGAGGQILNSAFTSTNGSNDDGYGVLLQTGNGGAGGKSGGNGGLLSNLTVSVTSVGLNGTDSDIYGAVILTGDGGAGTGLTASAGGAGGAISGISQPKDVYSVINLIQAGSGGNSSAGTTGGAGGSISNVRSAGAIGAQIARALPSDPGLPQGQFNTIATSATIDALTTLPDLQQGVFAGLGGTGSSKGSNGKVSNISAPAIAAIGAADLAGTFEQASGASKIATLLLAFDIDGSGSYQTGDGFVRAANFNPDKEIVSLDSSIITTAALIARTTPFVNP